MTWVWVVVVGIVAAVVGAACVLRKRFVAVRVEGASMEPMLRAGDRVLVRRVDLERVRAGQLVVFAAPAVVVAVPDNPPWLIKRAAALPGDPVPHAHVPALPVTDRQVPAGRFIALGDNAAHSHDSRALGYIAGEALLGVVVRVMRPSHTRKPLVAQAVAPTKRPERGGAPDGPCASGRRPPTHAPHRGAQPEGRPGQG